MHRALRNLAVPVAALLSAGVLAGCGSSGDSGGSAVDPGTSTGASSPGGTGSSGSGGSTGSAGSGAAIDPAHASSMHVSGTHLVSGKAEKIDVSVNRDGDCTGTVTVGTTPVGVVVANDTPYVKGSAAFWTAQAGADAKGAANLADQWVSGLPLAADLCPVDDLFDLAGSAQPSSDGPRDELVVQHSDGERLTFSDFDENVKTMAPDGAVDISPDD